jgi:hypothetical protein
MKLQPGLEPMSACLSIQLGMSPAASLQYTGQLTLTAQSLHTMPSLSVHGCWTAHHTQSCAGVVGHVILS